MGRAMPKRLFHRKKTSHYMANYPRTKSVSRGKSMKAMIAAKIEEQHQEIQAENPSPEIQFSENERRDLDSSCSEDEIDYEPKDAKNQDLVSSGNNTQTENKDVNNLKKENIMLTKNLKTSQLRLELLVSELDCCSSMEEIEKLKEKYKTYFLN